MLNEQRFGFLVLVFFCYSEPKSSRLVFIIMHNLFPAPQIELSLKITGTAEKNEQQKKKNYQLTAAKTEVENPAVLGSTVFRHVIFHAVGFLLEDIVSV